MKAVCTAEGYNLHGLRTLLRKNFSISELSYASFIHARSSNGQDVYFFKNGSFVVWGSDRPPSHDTSIMAFVDELRKLVKPFEIGSLDQSLIELEDMDWKEVDNGKTRVVDDAVIEINNSQHVHPTENVWIKLAISNGLSDSVKLAVLEGLLDKHIEKIKSLPIALEEGRRIPIGRAATLRLIGELLHFRATLNLDSEFLDTPEIYWSHPQMEELYKSVSRSFDTKQRISTLNKKMDYAEQISELLRTHLNDSHMFRLEWAIILLVGFEVVNSVLWWMV